MKIVGYARCSGKSQVDGDTWDRQTSAIETYALTAGHELARVYREEAVPGKTDMESRPAFQEMVSDLLSNGCVTIVVEGLDRLAREYRIQEQLIIYLASKQLTLISANTGEDITAAMMGDPMRRALVQIQGIFAELDKNLLVAKLRKARERKRSRGERVEGQKPYGHTPEESRTLARIRAWRDEGYTCERIANQLFYEGIPARSGGHWHPSSIAKILARIA